MRCSESQHNSDDSRSYGKCVNVQYPASYPISPHSQLFFTRSPPPVTIFTQPVSPLHTRSALSFYLLEPQNSFRAFGPMVTLTYFTCTVSSPYTTAPGSDTAEIQAAEEPPRGELQAVKGELQTAETKLPAEKGDLKGLENELQAAKGGKCGRP